MAGRIKTVLEMIKFEHSVFALPFALTGALLAARATRHGWPTLRQVLWIVVAMVAARSAAMTMNRIADLRYDRENPRTKQRALATGALSLQFAWSFTFVAVVVFFLASWQPSRLPRLENRRLGFEPLRQRKQSSFDTGALAHCPTATLSCFDSQQFW